MQIDLVTATPELMTGYPDALPGYEQYSIGGFSIFLEDGQWGQLAALETYLAQHPELGVEYNGNVFGAKKQYTEPGSLMSIAPYGVREKADASTVIWRASARQCAGIEGVGEAPISKGHYCGRCGQPHNVFDDSKTLTLRFGERTAPDLFRVNSYMVVVSNVFVEAIEAAGLNAGFATRDVKVDNGDDRQWYLIHPDCNLGWQPAPFGYWKEPCPECGHMIPRYALYSNIYRRPEKQMHWMTYEGGISSVAPLLVSNEVYRWLLSDGAHLLSEEDYEKQLRPLLFSWYPDDADLAFIPRRYHAEDAPCDDPAVLRAMERTREPIEEIDEEARLEKMAEETERGYYTSIGIALDRGSDIVYILDLSNKPIDKLYDEEMSQFRNLNELILKNTNITAIPESVFTLPNLMRLDLRGTNINQDDVKRIREKLRKNVKVEF